MKEYLTMKEAALLLDKTTKTIKNYIKRGAIRNFFLVEGKYGQEYKISVRDLEPLGMVHLEVLKDDFSLEARKEGDSGGIAAESVQIPGEITSISGVNPGNMMDVTHFLRRHEELILEISKVRQSNEALAEENKRLREEIGEKDMLIQVLMKKGRNC